VAGDKPVADQMSCTRSRIGGLIVARLDLTALDPGPENGRTFRRTCPFRTSPPQQEGRVERMNRERTLTGYPRLHSVQERSRN